MAIISANVQYNRGEHKLLDYSSLQPKYSTALAWAQDVNSNAAVGQFIYIEAAETIDGSTYVKGPYVVDAIGENAVLTPLSKGSAGDIEITDVVNEIKTDVSGLKTSVGAINTSIDNIGTEITGIKKDIEGLGEDLANIDIPVKDVKVGGASIVDSDGNAVLDDTLSNYVTGDVADNKYLSKDDAANAYAAKSDTYTKGQVDTAISTAIGNLDPAAATEDGKYVSGISLVNGKLEVSKTDLPVVDIPEYGISKTGEYEYTLTMDGSPVNGAVINIPKDMVVSKGEVVELADGEIEGKAAGTYIKLTIANGGELYINTTDLVDVYTAGDSYIVVNGYSISLNYSGLKDQIITDLADVYEAKGVASTLANNAKDAAIAAAASSVDTKLADYAKSADVTSEISTALGDYYTKGQVDNAVGTVKSTAENNVKRIEILEGLVVGGEGEGLEVIISDVATLKNIVGSPETATAEATGLVKDVIDLKSSAAAISTAVKTIVINGVDVPVVDNTATIDLVNDLSNVSNDKLAVSASAVISVIDNISAAVAGKSQIVVVDSMVGKTDVNTIYLHKDGDTVTEKVIIDGKEHILGSDLYASKAVATSTAAGLMSADDKARFDSMIPISTEELKGLGIN
jgi:hypothetical protein